MRKAVLTVASVILGAGLVYWLYDPGPDQPDPRQAGLDRARAYAEAQVQIERVRKRRDAPVDWAAVREQLGITLAVVREIDEAANLDYAKGLVAALDKCAAGQSPGANQQLIAKGLQHVTVLAIRRELALLAQAEGPHREAAAQRVAAFFEGIRPTFVRRDKDFFPGRGVLTPEADAALRDLAAAARRKGQTVGAGRQLEDLICRTYALSVLYEVQQIARLRHSDRAACAVKRVEGQVFYRIIRDRIARRDPRADETIRTTLEADYDTMDPAALEAALRRGLGPVPLE